MTAKEFYDQTGGDYKGTLARFMDEKRIIRFVGMFLRDPSYQDLKESLGRENRDDAFLAAHTLKGVCLNVGFSRLYDHACAVTEALRAGNMELAKKEMPALDSCYEEIVAAAKQL